MKTKVALAAAIVLAVVAMVGFRAYLKRVNEAAQEGRKPYPVLVAARNIRADTEVLAEDMEPELREAASVPRMALTTLDRERYRGRKVFRDIRRGDMLLASDFWQPAELEKFDTVAMPSVEQTAARRNLQATIEAKTAARKPPNSPLLPDVQIITGSGTKP